MEFMEWLHQITMSFNYQSKSAASTSNQLISFLCKELVGIWFQIHLLSILTNSLPISNHTNLESTWCLQAEGKARKVPWESDTRMYTIGFSQTASRNFLFTCAHLARSIGFKKFNIFRRTSFGNGISSKPVMQCIFVWPGCPHFWQAMFGHRSAWWPTFASKSWQTMHILSPSILMRSF